ncbi:MAG: oligosaccharide flippase family protein, partial [Bacilli bacterium]|nr:oligosaccharide flippase family protein [Bacilli bacterium]
MRINQYKAGVVLSYLTVFIGSAISIIYTPVMLRILGKREYGLYQLVFSVVGYLGLLNFGFGSSYIRFYSRYKVKDDRDGMARINGMFLTVFLVISLITVAAGSVLVFNIRTVFKGGLTGAEINTAKTLMTLMILNIALSFPASVFSSIVAAHERYFYHRMLHLIKAILNPFLTLPLLLLGYKSVSLIIVTTLLTLVCFIIDLWYCFNKLGAKFKFKAFDFNLLKEIWVFSFFIFINMITDQLNWSIDKFILGKYTGTIGVAVYSIGAQLNSYYLSFSTSISSVFIPRVNSIVAQNKDNSLLTELFTRVGRIQFIVLSLLMGGFILIGEYFISFWAGSGYRVSYYVALLLMIPVTVPLIQSIGIEIQRAKNL